MTSENIRYRADIINTQVITNDNAKRLGVVKDLLVDIDRREVVALGLRDNLLSVAGMPRYMVVESIRQWGDVILVDNEDAIEDIDVDAYSSLINSEVITETGEMLGKVRGFKFDVETGKLTSIIIATLGLPQIPDRVLSTYELSIEEVVSSGPNRLIVFEGAEERLMQLTVGFLERIGIGKPPWERDDEDGYYTPQVRPDNQLGPGAPIRQQVSPPPRRSQTPVKQKSWDEDDYEEQPLQPLPRRQREADYYEEEYAEDNWSEATNTTRKPRYQQAPYPQPPEPVQKAPQPQANPPKDEDDYRYDDDVEGDLWAEQNEPAAYKPQKLNITDKTKQPEYEEEELY
ncbi:PRC-barrel domain-containing protein [Merismopedia glauca]|uniref:Photosystem reaction center subunit H n=1 Tax=Merismopedia glauca CCAP 1448/3 TaxID=1296344 RepID=A0A2T1CAJ8_9CYAN|nr:PRC-barrel domain-containing protein [Merismopedia glauca]PSB05259.1 photosystem reaction center subunit H [Merismopedia glauca CCAP 1448/3]